MSLVPFPGRTTADALDRPADDAWPEDGVEHDALGARMSFLDHLEELRKRIVRSLLALVVGCVISFAFINRIFDFIMQPLYEMLPKDSPLGGMLIYSEPTEAFVLYLKIAMLAGIILAAPFILYQVWMFIAPGLYSKEKRLALPFVAFGTIGFVAGAAFSHYVAFPWTWQFLGSFGNAHLAFLPRVEPAFGLYVKMALGLGLIFQMPTLVFALSKMGVISARFLIKQFKYAVLLIFVTAAFITPTGDPLTQAVFAAPMIGLYLISIAIAWLFGKKRRAAQAD